MLERGDAVGWRTARDRDWLAGMLDVLGARSVDEGKRGGDVM